MTAGPTRSHCYDRVSLIIIFLQRSVGHVSSAQHCQYTEAWQFYVLDCLEELIFSRKIQLVPGIFVDVCIPVCMYVCMYLQCVREKIWSFWTTIFVTKNVNTKYAYQNVSSDMGKRMAHANADHSTTISCSVQSKEVLNTGPIAEDQLERRAVSRWLPRCRPSRRAPMELFENDMFQFARRSRLAHLHSVLEVSPKEEV